MRNNQYGIKSRYFIIFFAFTIFSFGVSQSVTAQTLKSNITLDSLDYVVELLIGINDYTITLAAKPDFHTSKNTSTFTLIDFKNIILGEHKNRLNSDDSLVGPFKYSSDSLSEVKRNTRITDVYSKFVSSMSLSAESGQRVGTIQLKKNVLIRGLNKPGLAPIQNRGSQKESLQFIKQTKELRKYIRQQSRSINWVGKRIKRLDSAKNRKTKRNKTFSKFAQAKLDSFRNKLKAYQEQISDGVEQDSMKVLSAQLVFEDGGIRQVLVEGLYKAGMGNEKRVYSNKFSIGASTRQNFKDFGKIKLYQETNFTPSGYIVFSDVLIGLRQPGLRTNDHSPADQSFVLYPGQTRELFKSPSSKLFSLNIFSDVVGFDADNPNGLIQLEFNKRINLWTKRTDARIFEFMGVGWLTYMMPTFELSKIEENNRILEVDSTTPSDVNKPRLSLLQLYSYSFTRITSEINILDFQAPSTSVHFNVFVGGALTNVRDSISNKDDRTNMLMVGQNLKILLNPESKWHYEIGIKTVKLAAESELFKEGSLSKDGKYENVNEWINSFEFLISWSTSQDHRLFGRVRFNHELTAIRNNFSQFQIGYSIFLKSKHLQNGR